MKPTAWFNLTRTLAGLFGIVAVVFLIVTSNPDMVPGAGRHSLFFSLMLATSGLSILFTGIHILIHERQKESAAMMIFLGVLLFLAGGFFLVFGLEA